MARLAPWRMAAWAGFRNGKCGWGPVINVWMDVGCVRVNVHGRSSSHMCRQPPLPTFPLITAAKTSTGMQATAACAPAW